MNEWQEKLDALKRHPLFPFPDFAKNLSHYALAQLYWSYLFRSLVQDTEWRPWHAPDTTGEGNPIFSAIHLQFRRGTRVIQHPERRPTTPLGKKYIGFQPFLSVTTAEPYDPDRTVLELCFVADISEETEARCLTFWRRFCIQLAPETQMEDEIRVYEAEVEMPAS
jgi:hypothetical protein